jgi:hypothetical protein
MEYAMNRSINRGYMKLDAWNRAQGFPVAWRIAESMPLRPDFTWW